MDVHMTSFHWACQELAEMPTFAQLATLQGSAKSSLCVCMTSLRWASQELTNVPTAAQLAAPQGDARSGLSVRAWRHSAGPPKCSRNVPTLARGRREG